MVESWHLHKSNTNLWSVGSDELLIMWSTLESRSSLALVFCLLPVPLYFDFDMVPFFIFFVESRDGSQAEEKSRIESPKGFAKNLPRKYPKGTCQEEGRVWDDPGAETRCLVRKSRTRVLNVTTNLLPHDIFFLRYRHPLQAGR